MDPLRITIAFAPLAAYLLMIGAINLQGRPLLTTGGRDAAALGLGVVGFFVVGPMELFMPQGAVMQLGGRILVWTLMLGLYVLTLTLCILSMRPRLIIYNVTSEQLHASLHQVAEQLDAHARWAGDALVLPRLGVQLHLETPTPLRNAQLVSSGPRQSYEGWRRLEQALGNELRQARGGPNWLWGLVLVSFAAFLAAGATGALMGNLPQAKQAWQEMIAP